MTYLFNASAIFRGSKENRVEVLAEGCPLDLARYELGNVLWKGYALHRRAEGGSWGVSWRSSNEYWVL